MLRQVLGSAVGKARYRIEETQRRRSRDWQADIRRSHNQAMILMYHRVARKDIDPWELCVTPENFEAHLQIVQRHMQPMSLRALAKAQQADILPDRAIAITFDDGYASNLYQAKPLLEKYNLPATVFVATGYTGGAQEFWWDALDRALLSPGILPSTLDLRLGSQPQKWSLGEAAHYSEAQHQDDHHIAAWDALPGSRLHFYHQVWAALQPLAERDRRCALEDILVWAEADPVCRESHRPMRPAELKWLEEGHLVTIGAHTVNHAILCEHSREQQHAEITASKAYLERLLDHPVDTFAYPFGAYQPETLPVLATADFLCACTTVEETIWRGNVCYELPRFDVGNWSGQEFEQRLLHWFKQGYA